LRRVLCHSYVVDMYEVNWLGGLTIEFWAVFKDIFFGVDSVGVMGRPHLGLTTREANAKAKSRFPLGITTRRAATKTEARAKANAVILPLRQAQGRDDD
jgi:hypothetical protein